MNRAEWLRELEAERVTGSRESFTEVVARLDMERPESPTQMQGRERLEMQADARVRAEKAALIRREMGGYTYLEQKLGELRMAALMDDITRTKWWAA